MTEPVCWDREELEKAGYTFVTQLMMDGAPGHGTIFNIARRRNLRTEQLVCYRLRPGRWGVFKRKGA